MKKLVTKYDIDKDINKYITMACIVLFCLNISFNLTPSKAHITIATIIK